MALYEYEFKHVKITTTTGKAITGFVDVYTSELDHPSELENIFIIPYNLPNWKNGDLLGLNENEISAIETIEPIEIMVYPKTYQPQAVAV
ncbi:MAG: hypothetical protein FWG68_12610 [Defluviitaleaceae bacterium]|nr:hypothetical protein [Defluviitaleaceae bacterium]